MAHSVAAARLAEARAILGGVRDPLRAMWDDSASDKDRRLLLLLAGCEDIYKWGLLVGCSWGDLKPELRSRIRVGLAKFRRWAALVEDGEVLP